MHPGRLRAEESNDATTALSDGADFERPEDKDHVPTTKGGDALEHGGGRDKIRTGDALKDDSSAQDPKLVSGAKISDATQVMQSTITPASAPKSNIFEKRYGPTVDQIFKSLGIDVSSPSTLMDNAMPAEAVTKPRTFADACTHPSAKRMTVHGRTGPVNAVEVDGTLFIQNDEAEAKAEATLSKAMGPASEAAATTAAASGVAAQAVASKAVATTAAASEVAAPALAPEPAVATAALEPEPCRAAASPAVIKSNSYAAAVSKPPVGPKFSAAASQSAAGPKLSAAASKLSADLKRPCAASKPTAAVLAPLKEPDDVIVAQRSCSGKALEKTSRGDIIGFAGDTDGEVQASNKLGAYTVPTTYLNNTNEAKVAAKQLGAETATQEEQAKQAEKEPVQAVKQQADTKQKIKKQAAAAKEDT